LFDNRLFVAGKGPTAAIVTSLLRYPLRATAVYASDPVARCSPRSTAVCVASAALAQTPTPGTRAPVRPDQRKVS
jgi:hypothetical protein